MQVIRFEKKDAVGHIVLANPPKNLIASNFSESLKRAVHEAGESDIRALLVRAEGPNFSQGGDVLDFLEKDTNQFRTFIGECNQAYRAIEALQIPTVAAVGGAAFGGAFELALACDFIVVAENAVFRCIEASVGSAPVALSVGPPHLNHAKPQGAGGDQQHVGGSLAYWRRWLDLRAWAKCDSGYGEQGGQASPALSPRGTRNDSDGAR